MFLYRNSFKTEHCHLSIRGNIIVDKHVRIAHTVLIIFKTFVFIKISNVTLKYAKFCIEIILPTLKIRGVGKKLMGFSEIKLIFCIKNQL